MDTPSSLADREFSSARRRAGWERFAGMLRRESGGLLCFSQLRDRLGIIALHKVGSRTIPLAAIVGSENRCSDYSRSFLPLADSDRERWTRVLEAFRARKALPPISVYHLDGSFFVVDGHHRVSIARQLGLTHIEARVVDVETSLPLHP